MFDKISRLKTLIRADSSALIGHGHIKRDLVLASKFKDISFACLDLKGSIIDEIKQPIFKLVSGDEDELIELIKRYKFELLIFDHYGIEAKFEKAIKDATGVKILSFDDEFKEHFCDILLNVNVYAKKDMYKGLLPSFAKAWCGRDFMLVRDEFYKEKEIKRQKKFDFFIGLGGSDVLGLLPRISHILLDRANVVAVVTTSANPMLNELINLSENHKNFNLFINSNNIAKIMNESSELIIQASGFVNEALVLNSSFIAVKTAQNQTNMCDWLMKNGFIVYEGDEVCRAFLL